MTVAHINNEEDEQYKDPDSQQPETNPEQPDIPDEPDLSLSSTMNKGLKPNL